MRTQTEANHILSFSHLPSFAQYLLTHREAGFAEVLKSYCASPAGNTLVLDSRELLECLAANKAEELIARSVDQWKHDLQEAADNHPVCAQDFMHAGMACKKAFLHFLPEFSRDSEQLLNLIQDTDLFVHRLETAAADSQLASIQELQQVEADFQYAQILAGIGNWTWHVKDDVLEWTDNLYRMYGMEPQSEEINIRRFLDFVHPADRALVQNAIDGSATAELVELTFRIKSLQGDEKYLRIVAQAIVNETGQVEKIIGITQDVTERQRMLENIRHSETLYKQAEKLAMIGSWSWDIEKNEVKWTEELFRIFGMEPTTGPINFERYTSLIHPHDRDHVVKTILDAIHHHTSYEVMHRIILPDGLHRTVQSHGEVLTNQAGKATKLVGTAQDVTERQQLIEQLQESQRITQQAQSLAHIGNWVLDLRTGIFQWSDEMYNIYELDKSEEVDLKNWEGYVHPDDKEEVQAYFQRCIAERSSYEKTHRILLRNGKVKTVYRKAEFIWDESMEPVKMLGTTQDVTEQHRVQEALKANQEFIRKIADATPSIISSYNVNTGRYTFINEGLKKLLGYETSEALEQGTAFFKAITHPDDLPAMIEKNKIILEESNRPENRFSNTVEEFRYRMRHINGNYRWFHTYGTIFDRNTEGHVEHVLNISLDVTEQVEAQEKIAEQQFFIEQVADASPTILYLFDIPSNSISYVNKEIFFILGYSTDEIIGMGDQLVKTLYHPEDIELLPERRESIKKFQLRNSMIQYECRMRTKDGDWNWILVREVVFKTDVNGEPLQILGAALDISKRKEIESTLLQNSFKLQQSNSSLEEFAYVASHDLKEPLRKISTFGDRLMQTQSEKLGDDGKVYLNKIVDASQRMQIMINDLLSISMITGNRSFEPYSLQAVLEDVKQTLEFKIDQKKATIIAKDLPVASIVPSQFRQLFQNLLSNSMKFVKENEPPVITIQWDYLPIEQVTGYQLPKAEKYLRLRFIDNGIGFEEEYAGKIFQIFQRLHGRSEYEGTGIGLAICKKIAEHHGGTIFAEGKPGIGSIFTIILPA